MFQVWNGLYDLYSLKKELSLFCLKAKKEFAYLMLVSDYSETMLCSVPLGNETYSCALKILIETFPS